MKIKTLRTQFIYALLGFALFSCSSQRPVPDGGPCSYKVDRYPATILLIDSNSENSYNLYLRVKLWGTVDTLDYAHVNHQFLTAKDVKGIKPGDSIFYEHHQITSGACNPDVYRFNLKEE